MNFSFYMPTRIFFGAGEIQRLGSEALPGRKALVVTCGSSVKRLGYLDRVLGLLAQSGCEAVCYGKIKPNPGKREVEEGAALCRAEGCDFVLGLGGGSAIDSAKAIAVSAACGGDYWDYIEGGSGKGIVPAGALPVVAVTTTAGTGTEADPWTVVTKEEGGEKIGGGWDCTFPVMSVVDPELMETVPPDLTAYQGFDALFHATEGYLNARHSPVSDLFALKAIEYIGNYLPRAVKKGGDKEARAYVALANTYAGIVESLSGCTAEHSIEHAMSGRHESLPHGAGLIMIAPAYYRAVKASGAVDSRLKEMSDAIGGWNDDFAFALEELMRVCGVDGLKMSDYGMTEAEIPALAAHAVEIMGGLFALDPAVKDAKAAEAVLARSFR